MYVNVKSYRKKFENKNSVTKYVEVQYIMEIMCIRFGVTQK